MLGGCRGFTAFPRQDYAQWKKEGRLINDGVNAKVDGARKHAVHTSVCTLAMCLLLSVAVFLTEGCRSHSAAFLKLTSDALCFQEAAPRAALPCIVSAMPA